MLFHCHRNWLWRRRWRNFRPFFSSNRSSRISSVQLQIVTERERVSIAWTPRSFEVQIASNQTDRRLSLGQMTLQRANFGALKHKHSHQYMERERQQIKRSSHIYSRIRFRRLCDVIICHQFDECAPRGGRLHPRFTRQRLFQRRIMASSALFCVYFYWSPRRNSTRARARKEIS